ncbi:hypothetical protein GCM10022205_25130 [Spinactinospora alkalitolerans]
MRPSSNASGPARRGHHDLTPTFVLAGLAVLPIPVTIAAWRWRRRALVRWAALALAIAVPVIGTLII